MESYYFRISEFNTHNNHKYCIDVFLHKSAAAILLSSVRGNIPIYTKNMSKKGSHFIGEFLREPNLYLR